jgi:hypothetical protein
MLLPSPLELPVINHTFSMLYHFVDAKLLKTYQNNLGVWL